MLKITTMLLGSMVLLPMATDAAQASGGCGPGRHRGAFDECWLNLPSYRPMLRPIYRFYRPAPRPVAVRFFHPTYVQRAYDVRPVMGYEPRYRYNRQESHHYSYHYHYSHYSYHYSHFSYHRRFHYNDRIVNRRHFVDQRRNLINEGRFLNREFHHRPHRYF